jgi:hypothetical protein
VEGAVKRVRPGGVEHPGMRRAIGEVRHVAGSVAGLRGRSRRRIVPDDIMSHAGSILPHDGRTHRRGSCSWREAGCRHAECPRRTRSAASSSTAAATAAAAAFSPLASSPPPACAERHLSARSNSRVLFVTEKRERQQAEESELGWGVLLGLKRFGFVNRAFFNALIPSPSLRSSLSYPICAQKGEEEKVWRPIRRPFLPPVADS